MGSLYYQRAYMHIYINIYIITSYEDQLAKVSDIHAVGHGFEPSLKPWMPYIRAASKVR